MPINKYRRNKENRKSPLDFHSNHQWRQDPQMNVKISGQNIKEKQYLHSLNYLPQIFIE